MFDRDSSGRIGKDKLGNMVRALGFNPTQQKIDEVGNSIASGKLGSIIKSLIVCYAITHLNNIFI